MANRSIDQKSITFTVLSKSTDSNCSKVRSINNLNLWTRDIEKNHCFKNLLPLERNDWLSRPSYAQKFLKDRYYLANNENKPVEYLNSGILYTELRKGCGSKPTVNSRVKVRYHGTLTSGKVFDSSYLRGKPDIFNLETVIEGLRKSISNMKEGSIWEIYIPYQEGFGHRNPGPIPPYSNLIFTIELISIE